MLIKYVEKIWVVIFVIIFTLLFFNSTLKAGTDSKTEAIDKALTETEAKVKALLNAKTESETETKRLVEADTETESKIQTAEQISSKFRQELESVITEEKEAEEFNQVLDSYMRFMPSRGVDAMSGKIRIIDTDGEYSYDFKLLDKLPVEISLNQRYIGIENSTEIELPAHLVGLSTGIESTLPFLKFGKTHLRLGVYPAFYDDDWNFHSSSFRMPSRFLLIHKPNSLWTFILGVAVYPDFETKVWPILGFIYKPNDKLTFNIVPERPNIAYLLNDKLTIFTEGGGCYDEFEVTKDDLKNVVLQYKELHLGAGIKYRLNKFIKSSISSGWIFNRQLKYRDSLGKVNIKDGVYSEFRVEIKI